MKNLLSIAVLTGSLTFSGCVQQPPRPQMTQLQIREFQTRTYQSNNVKMIMKAVINTLQDDGFLIRNADKELGFISASKEVDVTDQAEVVIGSIFAGSEARYKKSSTIESSVNITEFGRETKVRAVFQTKMIDNFGAPVGVSTIEDPKYYQDFFFKVDKGFFIEKQGM